MIVPNIAEHMLPIINDLALYPAQSYRRSLLKRTSGIGVEIGFGSGANAAHYPSSVEKLYAIEPSDPMWRRGRERAAQRELNIERLDTFAERLELPDDSLDFAVSTFVLCSVAELAQVLAQLHRVLKPGGKLMLIEHTEHPAHWIARAQKLVTPVWTRCLDGCHPGRPMDELLAASAFEAVDVRHVSLRWLPFVVKHHVMGTWHKPE